MSEIIPYIILIIVMLVLELIQVSSTKYKIRKWILPILSFLFSLFIMLNLIVFELGDHTGTRSIGLKEIFSATAWENLPFLNIPTIIFIMTNIITKQIIKKKEINNG